MTIAETIARLRSGEENLTGYLSDLCSRIEAHDPRIRALVTATFERGRVLEQAQDLLRRYPEPGLRPPLFGIPLGIKDIFRVDGYPTRCGSRLPPDLFEGEEAVAVSRLKRAGAIIMGKTATTEFAWMEPGPTRNPHQLEHTPGGSSSGSAAGVAAGFFPLALGTQTLGSIIRPAAYCGVIGFKPSYGRVPTSGVIPFSPSADHVGFFCTDPTGLHALSSVLLEDWRSADAEATPKTTVLGVPEGPYLAQASEDALRRFEGQLQKLLTAGVQIKGLDTLPQIEVLNEGLRRLAGGEMARVHADWYKRYMCLYRPRTGETIEQGRKVGEEELQQLREQGLELRRNLEEQMNSQGIDLWICPSATDYAPRGLESTGSPAMNIPWTYAGLPVLSLPAGTNDAGLPLGIQLIGRFGKDEALVAVAKELARALGED